MSHLLRADVDRLSLATILAGTTWGETVANDNLSTSARRRWLMSDTLPTLRSRGTRCGAIVMACLWLSVGTAAADAVSDWNAVVVDTIAGGRPNPETAAAAAYVHIAIYDAINSIEGGYTPFATLV